MIKSDKVHKINKYHYAWYQHDTYYIGLFLYILDPCQILGLMYTIVYLQIYKCKHVIYNAKL
jgi:ACR3 family arsenite efflux pump ArsB